MIKLLLPPNQIDIEILRWRSYQVIANTTGVNLIKLSLKPKLTDQLNLIVHSTDWVSFGIEQLPTLKLFNVIGSVDLIKLSE